MKANKFYIFILILLIMLFLHLYKQSLIVDTQYKVEEKKQEVLSIDKKIKEIEKDIQAILDQRKIIKKSKKNNLKKIDIKQIEKI